MPVNRHKAIAITVATIILLLAGNSYAEKKPDLVRIVGEREAALVTVKYVLSVSMTNQNRNQQHESENELTCSMISADGLLICSNNQLTGFIEIIKRLYGPAMGGMDMSATPKDLKVLVGPEAESFDAEILARDTELDIVWVRITDAGDNSFSYIDFNDGSSAGIGDPIVTIRRTGNNFGRTPVASQSYIGGISSKPRMLYIPGTASMVGAGLPVFNSSGSVIGLMVTQLPEDRGSSGSPMGMFGAGMTNLQDAMSGLVLPAAEVVKATQRAMEIAEPL